MKVGDLVRVTRPSIGLSRGTLGIIHSDVRQWRPQDETFVYVFETGKRRRALKEHLEIVNESR